MKSGGFTLLEVLVALAILALALAAVLGAVADSLAGADRAQALLRATLAAQALLDGAGLDRPLHPGRHSGIAPDGAGWSLEITPAGDGMLMVTATVDPPGAGGRLRLVTLRPAEP